MSPPFNSQDSPKTVRMRESVVSLVILGMLLIIGLMIYLIQFQFYPSVSTNDASLISHGSMQTAGLFKSLPSGIMPLTPPERLYSDNLSDKINGKAELYLSAGFKTLICQRFADSNDSAIWLEFYQYDMGAPSNAFSVYSMQRRDDSQPVPITEFAYQTPNALFLVHGKYYIEMIAATDSDEAHRMMLSLANQLLSEYPVETAPVSETELFPKPDLDATSITLHAANTFGFDKLNQVFTAIYTIENQSVMAFLSQRKSPQESEQLAKDYHAFLMLFGGNDLSDELDMDSAYLVEILDSYELIFSRRNIFAGVHEATSRDACIAMAFRLDKKLREILPDDVK